MPWPRIPYPRRNDRRSVVLAWAIPLLALFGPVLLLDRTFAFRDAAHYYSPLFRYAQSQWSQGLPLWNPQEENGRPLLADPTASVLYPGKLVFALPGAFSWKYRCYIVGHVVLAAWGAYLAARSIGCGVIASGFGGLAYAFGGSVCFQYCNVIYLVGAAWLPLGLMALMKLMGDQVHRGIRWLSLVLAMTVLGGDPQTAYVLVLAGLIYLLLAAISGSEVGLARWGIPSMQPEAPAKGSGVTCRSKPDPFAGASGCRGGGPQSGAATSKTPGWDEQPPGQRQTNRSRVSWLAVRGGGLLLACLLSLGLAAVQVWPSWGWARVSERAITPDDTSQSLPDWIRRGAPLGRREWSGLYQTPDPGSHRDVLYRFSVGPWRWPELIWPSFGGRPFPVHQRWMNAIPAEGAFWTPSLYMGLWPALLGLAGLSLRRPDGRHRRWLSWLAVGSMVACLGQYGMGWLLDEFRYAMGADQPSCWSPVGGLYWLITVVSPGFILFRYPAKLWCLAALGLSLLAAHNLDRLRSEDVQRWYGRMRLGLTLLALTLLIGWMLGGTLSRHLESTPPDALFGPLDSTAAWRGFLQGGLHLLVVVAVSTAGLRIFRVEPRRAAFWILFLTAIELAWSQSWMVPTVPQRLLTTRPPAVEWMGSAARPAGDAGLPCYLREQIRGWYPASWALTSSARRLEACVCWDRLTLRPKYHLDFPCRAAASVTSFSSADYRALLQLLDRARRTDPPLYSALVNVMGIQHIIVPTDAAAWHEASGRPTWTVPMRPEGYCLVQNPAAFPRAWIVHQAQQIAPLETPTWSDLDRQTELVFRADGRPRDLSQVVMIEAAGQVVEQRLEVPAAFQVAATPDTSRKPEAPAKGSGSGRQTTTDLLANAPGLPNEGPQNARATSTHRPPGSRLQATCAITVDQPTRVEVEATLPQAGYLVLNDAFADGWTCESHRSSGSRTRLPVLRANRVMRCVALPAGRHRLVFRYQPNRVVWGGLTSGFCWLGLACWMLRQRLARR